MGNVGSDYYEPGDNYGQSEETKYLHVKTITSGRESYELFDYHCSDPIPKNYIVKSGK